MKLLFLYIKKYWRLIVLTLFLAAVNQIFSLLDPLIFRHIIDQYVTKFQEYTAQEFFRGVGILLAAAVGVAFVSRVAKNFQDYFINVITQRLGAEMYSDGLRHSLELPFQVFEDQRSGETLGKLQKVRTDVERLISASINVLFMTLVGVIFVMVYAISIYWIIAPVYFSTIPILGWLSSTLGKKIKTIQKRIVGETTALAGSTTESLRNIELVKSLGLAQQEIDRLNSTTVKILGLELKKVRYLRSLSFIQGTSVNFLRTTILGLMLYLIFAQQLTFGEFFSLWIYSFFIFGPLQELGNVINIYREAEASLQNFQQILATPKEPKPLSPNYIGKIDRPKSGSILYNGHPSTEVNLDKLRERIGFVTQDTQLFAGSIKENLLFVNPNATDDECIDVLQKAAAHSLLRRAENSLETVIGEGGIKVSGGEKQRLSIARALLRRPDLLIFDEATSSLDSLTEEEITVTIREISDRDDLITILIAHRLSTVIHADKIFVLEKGQIIETGSHEQLLEKSGLYYAMWRQQIGERQTLVLP
jgi:ATP-binding cassette subfamily B protein